MSLRERLVRHVNRNELPYRARGEHHNRLEAFSDAVLAFAITLSVLSLEVPKDSHELLHLARGFGSFLFTFAVLFGTWTAQNRFFRRYGLEDDRTIWTCGGILFVVVFYTYPLKFVASHEFDPLFGLPGATLHREDVGPVFALYGVGYSGLCLLFWSLYQHVWNLRDILELDEAERLDTRLQIRQWLWSAGFGVFLGSMLLIGWIPKASPLRLPVLVGFLVVLLVWFVFFALALQRSTRERRLHLEAWRKGMPSIPAFPTEEPRA